MADFKNVPIDPQKVPDALVAYGLTDLAIYDQSAKERHFTGQYGGKQLRIKLFINSGGRCTVGRFTGEDEEAFKSVAEHICKSCSWGEKPRLEYSLQKQTEDVYKGLVDTLVAKGAEVQERKGEAHAETLKVRGPLGDMLTIKFYSNATLHLQGSHAQLGAWAVDHLQRAMGLDELLAEQRKVYDLPLTVEQVRDELGARIPNVHGKLADEVRKQFSSAHAMTKVAIPLEDYAVVAFPVLRGLEGFCMQLLTEDCNLHPPQNQKLGEYFEAVVGQPGVFKMKSPASDGVGISLQRLLSGCYTTWNRQRHRLFHMDGTVETTRILDGRDEAVAVVEDVFRLIDAGYADYRKNLS